MNSYCWVTGVRAFGRRGLSLLAVLVALLIAPRSFAATITVNVTGGPQSNKCNLTDAVQAAVTNKAVHSCTAGSSNSTDTIQLAGNVIYQNYGKLIHVPSTGGTLVIQGKVSNGEYLTNIRAPNYGYPSPNPLAGASVCPYPAAIFSGGSNLTLKDLNVQSSVFNGTTGICQYAGTLTLNNVVVGDPNGDFTFGGSGLVSHPNTTTNQDNHRILNMTNSFFYDNYTPPDINGMGGGGVQAAGYVDVTMSGGGFEGNESSGMAWSGDQTAKLRLSNLVEFAFNQGGFGAGLYLYLTDSATVNISHCNFTQNSASQQGGAIHVAYAPAFDTVVITDGSNIYGNYCTNDSQQASLSSDWPVYDAVLCNGSSDIESLHGSEWDWTSPPLRGDGTCTFPTSP